MKGKISLVVTMSAEYVGVDAPPGDTGATETGSITLPYIDGKYIVMPKLLEGVMDKVIESHVRLLDEQLAKVAEVRRLERERQARIQLGIFDDSEESEA